MHDRQLFEAWRRANSTSGNIDYTDLTRSIISGERKTALMRLADRYKGFYRMSFIIAGLQIAWASNPLYMTKLPFWVIPLVGLFFFLLAGGMDVTLYNRIRDIDVLSMSVSDVIRRAADSRRFHLRCILILLPIAFTYVGLMVWSASDNIYFIYGAAVGIVIGMSIGIYHLNKIMQDYRLIMRHDNEE